MAAKKNTRRGLTCKNKSDLDMEQIKIYSYLLLFCSNFLGSYFTSYLVLIGSVPNIFVGYHMDTLLLFFRGSV